MQKLLFLKNAVARQWANDRSDVRDLGYKRAPQLPAYAWPGGYPIIYLDGFNSVLCAVCATESIKDSDKRFRPQALDIHYEGPAETCENCNVEIPSVYGGKECENGHGFICAGETCSNNKCSETAPEVK